MPDCINSTIRNGNHSILSTVFWGFATSGFASSKAHKPEAKTRNRIATPEIIHILDFFIIIQIYPAKCRLARFFAILSTIYVDNSLLWFYNNLGVSFMKSHSEYLWFNTKTRRDFINITPKIEESLRKSGVKEGFCLVNAMHITASVFVNDDESGLHKDFDRWLEGLAPHAPTSEYNHNLTGEDNADAHLKSHTSNVT